jgi:hypothetical protein
MGGWRRWFGPVRHFALGLALGLAFLLCSTCALAQACLPQILSIQSAKAAGLGPPPIASAVRDWHNVTLPDHWLDRWPGYSGAVWYRIDWQRGCAHPPAASATAPAAAVGLHTVESANV